MQYMLLINKDETAWDQLSATERDRIWDEAETFTQEIVKSGHFRAGAPLHPAATATTLRQKNGRAIITDGPFAETKEVLAGYCLIEARDLGEALAIAARVPILRVSGSVEVRPVGSRC